MPLYIQTFNKLHVFIFSAPPKKQPPENEDKNKLPPPKQTKKHK